MKGLFVAFLLAITLVNTQNLQGELKFLDDHSFEAKFTDFLNFVKTYNRSYESQDIMNKKFETFKENFKFTKGKVNEFTDLTPEEFKNTYLTLKVSEQELSEVAKEYQFKGVSGDVPASWDWREHGAVTPIKNQGQCGSCWAFSAVGNIEGQYAIKTKNLVQFSEQQIVDCDTVDHGCRGGWQERAMDYVIKAGGIENTNDYKYIASKGQCSFDSTKVQTKVTEYNFVSKDEEEIKQALYENGPLSAALNAQMLQWYFGGIFHVRWPFTCDPKLLNHAVLIVGYGTDIWGTKYWLVKNSWGTWWGESGYFRMVRGENHCGINTHVLTAKLS